MTLSLYQFLALSSVFFVIAGSFISLLIFKLIINFRYRNKENGHKFLHSNLSFNQKLGFNAYISLPSALVAIFLAYLFVNSPIDQSQNIFLEQKIEYKKTEDVYIARYLIKQLSTGDNILTQGEFDLILKRISIEYNYIDLVKLKLSGE